MSFKSIITLLGLCVFLSISPNAESHSGKLNKQDCHNNYETGDYHCHASISKVALTFYDRKEWKFDSKKSPHYKAKIGFYTGLIRAATDVDHVVALHDAFMSGGTEWASDKKKTFANDAQNQVPAVPYVNRTLKRDRVPSEFITTMITSDYNFFNNRECEYIHIYVNIKRKYDLSFRNNNIIFLRNALRSCERFSLSQ